MKLIEKNIDWIVVVTLGLLGPFDLFQAIVNIFWGNANILFNILRFVLIFVILLYQKKHYGFKTIYKPFLSFFVLYTFFVLFYLTILNDKIVEGFENFSIITFIFKTTLIVSLFMCADTFLAKFNCIKFLFLSVFLSILPAIFYIQTFGTEVLQESRLDVDDPDRISLLGLGYSGATLFVMSFYLSVRLLKTSLWLFVLSVIISLFAGYMTIISGERGPIIWGLVSLCFCFFITSNKIAKNIVLFLFLFILLYLNIDFLINVLSDFAPKTADKIYSTIYEGNTSGRLDMDNPNSSSVYGDAIKQFLSSPLWGSYFRITRDYSFSFRGYYPHNVFLEFLLTMGLLGFIPFCLFLYRAFHSFRIQIRRQNLLSMMGVFVLFIFTFLRLQSSGTIYLNIEFWLYFYLMSVMPLIANRRYK